MAVQIENELARFVSSVPRVPLANLVSEEIKCAVGIEESLAKIDFFF